MVQGSEPPVTTNITLGGLVSATVGGTVANNVGTTGQLELGANSFGIVENAAATAGTGLAASSVALRPASGQRSIPDGTILTLRILAVAPIEASGTRAGAQGSAVPGGGGATGRNPATVSSGDVRNQAGAATPTLEQQPIPGAQNATQLTPDGARQSRVNLPHATGTNPQGAVVAGTVLGTNASGQTVVQTDLGVLTLTTPTTLPPGTGLQLDLLAISGPSAVEETAASSFAQQWTGLAEALSALQREHPVGAQRLMQSVLPQPGPHLALAMLYFMSVLQSGNLRGWIGEQAAQALERGRRPLLERLVDDFMHMQRLATDSTSSEWRTHLIPLFAENQLQQLRVFMRRGDSDEAEDAEDAGTRFVIEVNFSTLGAFQLDGFVRRKHFDLVIRTHQDLGQTIQTDIDRIYGETLLALDFSGSVRFQATETFELRPSEDVFGKV